MTSNTADSGAHLTTSRINRLLRPLRNKCSGLAALSKTAVTSRVTYSKQLSNWDPESYPPLTVLSLAGTKKYILDSRSIDEFELSRRIYAVCDAFRNIGHVTFAQSCSERIPSLAALCTVVIGGHMPPSGSEHSLLDSGEGSADDILDVDGIYEAVPPHCRRFLIASHALSMILSTCTHHHTLMVILLDHCLSFGLVHESTHLLSIVLTQAFLPSNPSYPPPIMHPSHTNYLLDLHTKWTIGNNLSATSPNTSLFTTSTFCRVLFGVLSRSSSCNLRTLWSSKVLDRLFLIVQGCDTDSYIFIVHALSRAFLETSGSSPDAIRNNVELETLRDKLSEMMSNLFDLLFTRHDHHSLPLTPSKIHSSIDILYNCHAAQLHRSRMSTPGTPIDLPDIITIFTTHVFVAFRNSAGNFDRLLAILDDSDPVPTTFSKLMAYFTRFQGRQTFGDLVEAFLSELKLYSSALRSEKLFRLDASLWACGLRHFEASIATSQKGSSTLVSRYKQQFMEAVDAAECRCFGGDMNSSPAVSSIPSTHAGRTHRIRTSGHWEWEDMVGSWIRRTPVHKKRKIDGDFPHIPLQHSHSRLRGTMTSNVVLSTPPSIPLRTHHRRSSVFSSSTSYSQFSEYESHTEDGSEYQETDKENYPSKPRQVVRGSRRIERRNSNFYSLLADAQVNRIVLHSKPDPKEKPPSSAIPEKYVPPFSSQDSQWQDSPSQQERKTRYRKVSSPKASESSRTILLSDDSLDLFAYATSSPTKF